LTTNNKNRLHHPVKDGEDDLFFQLDPSRFRLYQSSSDPSPISAATIDVNEQDFVAPRADDVRSDSEFAYEHDLRDYLAKNLHLIEPGLRLYTEEGVSGIEFPVGGRFVDILAVDSRGAYVVIELKVSRGYDRVVGQLLRYMTWIEQHHADPGQEVHGVIVAKDVSEDLRLACAHINAVRLFEYIAVRFIKAHFSIP
jgi:hypothetical protein